jgi:ubiquinone/menaquinone biosynthesis C-methylase UbiE
MSNHADGGWSASASAWLKFQDDGADVARTKLLDGIMLRLAGDVAGKRILDVGCGEGRFMRMLAQRGARAVGIDPTLELVAAARDRGSGPVLRASGETIPLATSSIDLAVSYITLVDIPDFRAAIEEMARVLRPGGQLLVANLSFVTASEGWSRDERGKRLYHRVDRYVTEWSREYEWNGISIVNHHRPLAAYMRAYLDHGLILRDFLEPAPPPDSPLRHDQYFEDWFRVNDFTVMLWEKPAHQYTRST